MNLFKELHTLKNSIKENKKILCDWKKYNPNYFIKNSVFLSFDFEQLVLTGKITINHLMHFKTGILI
jgi:hypothetical protein